MKKFNSLNEALRVTGKAAGKSDVEIEIDIAVMVYEDFLSSKNGKRTNAGRTNKIIKERGAILGVDHLVSISRDRSGFTNLAEGGQLEQTFEAIVVKYPKEFSQLAQQRARERLENFRATH